MSEALNLLPARVAIGRADASGAVYITEEFARVLAGVLGRVGGPLGVGTDDLAVEAAFAPQAALMATLQAAADELQARIAGLAGQLATVAELVKRAEAAEALAATVAPPTDWEHPGKIGATTPNSGKFATLQATAKVMLNPLAADVEIKPTGVALVTIKPEQPGQADNMELGKTAPQPARVATLNKMTFTQPATGATWTLADGKTFTVSNTLGLSGTDGATLNIGGGGALGSAAFASAASFASRPGTALGAAATDAATTQTLANNMRSALLAAGIGS